MGLGSLILLTCLHSHLSEPFLPSPRPSQLVLLQDEPNASGSASAALAVFLESTACSMGCPSPCGSRDPGGWADVLTQIAGSCRPSQLGFGLASSD